MKRSLEQEINRKLKNQEELTKKEKVIARCGANPKCGDCDGTGLFYWTICVCGCVTIQPDIT